MCLNLIGSQFQSIKEVETLLDSKILKLTEQDIIAMKDNRELIEQKLETIKDYNDIMRLL